MKWDDAYDIKPSKNIRGENVYDIYKKGTEEVIWVDIPVADIDDFLKGMVRISEKAVQEEMDKLFSNTEDKPKEHKPMEVKYDRLRTYPSPWVHIDDEEK